MTFRSHIPATLLLAALLAVSSGCVYYNTFYNARKRYDEADRRRHEAEQRAPGGRRNTRSVYAYRDLYMKAITKASVVLDRHPKSKWVDDSLLLIGKAFYWRGGYKESLVKFEELRQNFPESELIEESRYWHAMALWGDDRLGEARDLLRDVGQRAGQPFSGKARLALGDLESEQSNYTEAIDAYREALAHGEAGSRKAGVWEGIGNAHFELDQYDQALEAYKQVLRHRSDTPTNYRTRLQIGAIHETLGQLDDAMRTYKRILGVKRLYSYESQVELKRANVLRLMGRLDDAIALYEDVVKRFPRSDDSAQAYYRMGRIEQKQRRDIEKAQELFGLARKEKASSEGGRAAAEIQRHLKSVEKFRKQVEKEDEGSLDALFSLAETYLFDLSEPDSALAAYRRVLDRADTTDHAPKAMFAIGLIYADSLLNEAAAREAFQSLIARFPVSPHAIQARARIQQERVDDALAEARFREAEDLRLEGAAPGDFISILEQLPQEYPGSLFAPQALYALAWTYQYRMRDLSRATEVYQQVIARYPLTKFSDAAQEKIDNGSLKPPEPAEKSKPEKKIKPSRASKDTAAATPDTVAVSAAPEPVVATLDSVAVPPDTAAVATDTMTAVQDTASAAPDTSVAAEDTTAEGSSALPLTP